MRINYIETLIILEYLLNESSRILLVRNPIYYFFN